MGSHRPIRKEFNHLCLVCPNYNSMNKKAKQMCQFLPHIKILLNYFTGKKADVEMQLLLYYINLQNGSM